MVSTWDQYWHNEHQLSPNSAHESVGRVINGEPVANSVWIRTVEKVSRYLGVSERSSFLDLCGGNGLLSSQLPITPKFVVCADLNHGLLNQIQMNGISKVQLDVRNLPFGKSSFTAIAVYAALQYLTEAESLELFEDLHRMLANDGKVFIGDIPDYESRMRYFSLDDRIARYFNSIKLGRPMIGTWFQRDWIAHALHQAGFSKVSVLEQSDWEPYADFRFDVVAER